MISVWNINCDRRQSGKIKEALPECCMSERFTKIRKQIKKRLKNGGLFILLEVDNETCKKLDWYVLSKDWLFESAHYNSSETSFSYVVIYTQGYCINYSDLYPLTMSGLPYSSPRDKSKEHLLETFNEEFEKGVFHIILTLPTSLTIDLFVVHLGLKNDSRLLQTKKLQEYVASHKKALIVGDLNSFDSTKKEPTLFTTQLDMLLESGFLHSSNTIQSTFDNRFFPYDLQFKMTTEDKQEYDKLLKGDDHIAFREFLLGLPKKYSTEGVALDHVFSKGIDCTVKSEALYELSDHSLITVSL